MSSYAIASYPDAKEITRLLDDLIKKPIYSIRRDVLEEYEREYFDKKCWKSKEMINVAKELIPGGVQHNLAFNHPFPLVIEKAQGCYLYDIDGNRYYDFAGRRPHGSGQQPSPGKGKGYRTLERMRSFNGSFP